MATSNGDFTSYSHVDSQRFGVRVARTQMTEDALQQALSFCAAESIDLLIARCSTRDLTTLQKMETAGFQLMDTLIYYSFDLVKKPIPDDSPRASIRNFTEDDTNQIEKIAAAAFAGYYGHYHADSRLDRHKCDEGYVSWAVRSCSSKEVADEVLVAELDTHVVGFATLRRNSREEGEGVLFAVAPEAQGSGIYRSFMIGGMNWCREQGVKRMVVSTQITNIAVQKVWCRVGFEPAHSYYTLHKWF